MNIPEESVEAAYKAHLAHKAVRSPGNAKNAMREAVEAAAPLIMAQALREAAEVALGATPYLVDAATCRAIANDLRSRADQLEPQL